MKRRVFWQMSFWGLALVLSMTQGVVASEMNVTYTITPVTKITLVTEQTLLVANEVNQDAVRINVASNITWRLILAYNSTELLYYRLCESEPWQELSCYHEFTGSRGMHDLNIELCYFSDTKDSIELSFKLHY